MSYSFAGTTIRIQNVSPGDELAAAATNRHIPGGNVNYTDIGGQGANTLSLTLFFATYSAFLSFKAQVGATGSLVYQDGTVTALLTRLSLKSRNLGTNGEMSAQADFMVLTPGMQAAPPSVVHGTSVQILLYGYGTSWTGGTTASVTGGTGASITGQSILGQVITMTVNPGSAAGTLTFHNSTDSLTCTVAVS